MRHVTPAVLTPRWHTPECQGPPDWNILHYWPPLSCGRRQTERRALCGPNNAISRRIISPLHFTLTIPISVSHIYTSALERLTWHSKGKWDLLYEIRCVCLLVVFVLFCCEWHTRSVVWGRLWLIEDISHAGWTVWRRDACMPDFFAAV